MLWWWWWWLACTPSDGTDPRPAPGPSTSPTWATPPTRDCPPTGAPSLATTTGCVEGMVLPSGREQFLGIPYAEPPVGALRFAPPTPKAPWSGVRAATKLGPSCVQFGDSLFGVQAPGDGAEDCLTLNVTRPAGANGLPVMFFVHGGGHVTGSGGEGFYVDDPALAAGAVLVTVNYRLGPLGFLAHPELSDADPEGSSGNYGFQDVILALRWVNDHVAALGGDPDRITVFGESAGALETCALLASPRAAGLFDAAIAQSGPCNATALPIRGTPLFTDTEEQGEDFAAAMGCADVTCLREAPVDALVAVGVADLIGPSAEDDWNWRPSLDGVWLPPDIPAAMKAGDWNQVPFLATVTANEGTLFTLGAAPDQAALDRWISAYALLLGVPEATLAAVYDPAAFGSTDAAFAALWGDISFVCPTIWQQATLAAQGSARGGFFTRGAGQGPLGAYHASEIPFVFGTALDLGDAEALALSAAMRDAWISMSGPAPTIAPLGAWPTVDIGWVELDVDAIEVVAPPYAERCAVWETSRGNPWR